MGRYELTAKNGHQYLFQLALRMALTLEPRSEIITNVPIIILLNRKNFNLE